VASSSTVAYSVSGIIKSLTWYVFTNYLRVSI
jgi:hypothetical protein